MHMHPSFIIVDPNNPSPSTVSSRFLALLDSIVMPKRLSRRKNLTEKCDVTPEETTEDIQEGNADDVEQDADDGEDFGDDGVYDPDYKNEEEEEDDDVVACCRGS